MFCRRPHKEKSQWPESSLAPFVSDPDFADCDADLALVDSGDVATKRPHGNLVEAACAFVGSVFVGGGFSNNASEGEGRPPLRRLKSSFVQKHPSSVVSLMRRSKAARSKPKAGSQSKKRQMSRYSSCHSSPVPWKPLKAPKVCNSEHEM